jgi:hypothetical protein
MALIKCSECGKEVSNKADACPNCGAKVKKASLITKIDGGFILLVVLGIVFSPNSPSTSTTSTSTDTSNSPSTIVDQKPVNVFATTAEELANAYDQNTVAADSKFKGVRFQVTGAIHEINTDMMGHAVLILKGGVNEFMDPQFTLDDSEKQKAAGLQKGMSVSMSCEGNGDIAKSPMSKDCYLM